MALSFTADALEAACERHGVQHRKTRPYTPKTNGMVERFNGRVQREVLGIVIYSHGDLETVLRGFNAAYNGRRQRVLKGLSPEMVLRQRIEADPALANPSYKSPKPGILRKARRIVADAKEVSQPDTCLVAERRWDVARWAIKAYAWRFAGVRRRAARRAR